MKMTNLAATSMIAALLGSSAFAQQALNDFSSANIDDVIEDIEEDVSDAFDPADELTVLGVPQGWNGSLAFIGSFTSGNTDTADMSLAARLTYGAGVWSHSFALAGEFGEENGVRSEEKFYASYEAGRAINDMTYVFGLARAEYDTIASNEIDGFIGVGLGFRLPMGPQVEWRLQAGPGARFIRDDDGVEVGEPAAIIASRYVYNLSDVVTLTNDTDVLGSDLNVIATNEFGVNVRMSDTLSTRVSYRTEWNSDPLPGIEDLDSTLGVALVVGF